MKFPHLLFLALTFIAFSCRKDDLRESTFDIVIIAGQSNTHYGMVQENYQAPTISEKVFQLGRKQNDYEIIPAKQPLDHWTKAHGRVGFGLVFADYYVSNYLEKGHDLLLIPCGKSGSSFLHNDWNPGDELFEDMLKRSQYVLSQHPNSKLIAMLWHQGESDGSNEQYQDQLDEFISQFRKRQGTPDLPIILGGMLPSWIEENENLDTIQSIIKETPERHLHTGYADPNYPFVIEKTIDLEDQIHYDGEGLKELGKRYFLEYVRLQL